MITLHEPQTGLAPQRPSSRSTLTTTWPPYRHRFHPCFDKRSTIYRQGWMGDVGTNHGEARGHARERAGDLVPDVATAISNQIVHEDFGVSWDRYSKQVSGVDWLRYVKIPYNTSHYLHTVALRQRGSSPQSPSSSSRPTRGQTTTVTFAALV